MSRVQAVILRLAGGLTPNVILSEAEGSLLPDSVSSERDPSASLRMTGCCRARDDRSHSLLSHRLCRWEFTRLCRSGVVIFRFEREAIQELFRIAPNFFR